MRQNAMSLPPIRPMEARAVRFAYASATAVRILLAYRLLAGRRSRLSEEEYAQQLTALHERGARTLYDAALRLQGLMIKIGQTIGSRPDIFPSEYTSVLSRLQDRVPPRPFSEIGPHIEGQLGARIDDAFAEFERTPIAAASPAQVYRARLHNGREVAVKVVYPAIARLVRTDLQILRMLIWLETRFTPYPLQPVYDELSANIPHEVNMRQEARNMQEIAALLSHRRDVIIPEVIPEYTRKRVLVMEYVDGIKISDMEGLRRAGLEPERLFEVLTDVYFEQMFSHGVFHADPHPGNLLGLPGNRLAIVDFGLTKRFTPEFRRAFTKTTRCLFSGDEPGMIEGMRESGFHFQDGATEPYRVIGEFFRAMSDPNTYNDKDVLDAVNQSWNDALRKYPLLEMPGQIALPMRVFGLLFGLGALVGGGISMSQNVISDAILRRCAEDGERPVQAAAS